MTRQPLPREKADILCKKFQHLVGEPLDHLSVQKTAIKHVTVSPFDEINMYIFLLDYRKHGDVNKALTNYSGNDFDVIIIAENVSEKLFIK